jgi:hypothetical protein
MLPDNNFKRRPPKNAVDSLLVTGNFIGLSRIGRLNQGVSQLTVTAREWTPGHYFVRFIISLRQGTFLYSQNQPANMRSYATRIEFSKNAGFLCEENATVVGAHFIHSDGAYGLKPFMGNKITFIQQVERRNALCDIAGRIHYQAFTENIVLDPCIEDFRIRLDP